MYIQRNKVKSKSGKEYRSVLLCSKYRQEGKIKTRTEANLSRLPESVILGIENLLKSDSETTVCLKDIQVERCVNYGYVFVLLYILKQLRIEEMLDKTLSGQDAALVKAMIIGKIVTGGSKLCIYNWLGREEAICKQLGLDMSGYKVDHLYQSLGHLWLQNEKIEKKWFRYHRLAQRRVFLYDITSSYFEGVCNELAAYGYNRDGKRGKMQLCVGLLTDENGFPIRIQAFTGNTPDSNTVKEQIFSLKKEFGVEQVVFVGDRGMQIIYHLDNDTELAAENIQFITGLTHAQIQTLLSRGDIQMSLFGSQLAEVEADGNRYILSINPELERKELLFLNNQQQRCQAFIENIRQSWTVRCTRNRENLSRQQENPRKNKHLKTELNISNIDKYKRRVEQVIQECSMSKYYTIETIDNQAFDIHFDRDEFEKSRFLCGKYVVCTNVPPQEMTTEEVRGQYKKLQNVEHAFRDLKSENISIRPIFHCNEIQTRGHVLLCILAYAIIKTMEDKLFPFLKEYNQKHKTRLSFNDLTVELTNITMCELNLGRGVTTVKYPKLNALQKNILEIFNIDPKKLTT